HIKEERGVHVDEPRIGSVAAGVRPPRASHDATKTKPALLGPWFGECTRTDWHCDCANALVEGSIGIPKGIYREYSRVCRIWLRPIRRICRYRCENSSNCPRALGHGFSPPGDAGASKATSVLAQ